MAYQFGNTCGDLPDLASLKLGRLGLSTELSIQHETITQYAQEGLLSNKIHIEIRKMLIQGLKALEDSRLIVA